ncbi:hypothetical protein [Faecalibaculum rodentium]|uniref:hypothetical protein n=1 Tax=Faecalibaculum rodentium TaxID=1702221 RepID=UPI0023EFA653|nr:hypothetical protein [Faecalibaculum rodentium]
MSVKLSSYPQIGEFLLDDAGWKPGGFRFYYEAAPGEPRILTPKITEDDENISYLEDSEGNWDPDADGFTAEMQFSLKNPEVFFGKSGVVCSDAEIGVGLQWYSRESRQRGSMEGMVLNRNDRKMSGKVTVYFEPGQIRGDLTIQPLFYLKTPGVPMYNEVFLANRLGMILGIPESPSILLRFDGTGSTFPIAAENLGKTAPLWTLYYDSADPETDQFSDAVALTLNRDHPAYPQINRTSTKFNPYLLIQVLASCLTQIIQKTMEDDEVWERIMSGDDLEEGSVAQAINYYAAGLDWDTSDIISLSESARMFLGRKVSETLLNRNIKE